MDDKPKIMVVDDSEMSRQTLKGFFTEVGCDVVCEGSGEGAWMALNTGRKIDLVILDWHMPLGMSGPQLNRKIMADKNLKKIPVVAFSSKLGGEQDSPEKQDWIASFADGSGSLKMRESSEVAKLDANEDARRIPPELVLNVADRLIERGVPLPALFERAVKTLKTLKPREEGESHDDRRV